MFETDYVIERLLSLGERLSKCERQFLEDVRGTWLTRSQRRKIAEITERVQLGVERKVHRDL